MSCPSRRTCPSTRAFGIVSCIRFRHRMSVDFPQPEGPMIPVTACSSKSKTISWMASFSPYQADTLSTWSFVVSPSPLHGPQPNHRAGGDADAEHQEHEDERGAPSGLVLGQGGRDCELIHLSRHRRDRLVEPTKELPARTERQEERSRLSSDAGNSQESSRDQA